MKNSEKYKSVQERTEAFADFCRENCRTCPAHASNVDCRFAWLDLEADEEKAMSCPCCGGDVVLGFSTRIKTGEHRQVWCMDDQNCGYCGPMKKSLEEAISAHNILCRAVMDAKNAKRTRRRKGENNGSK